MCVPHAAGVVSRKRRRANGGMSLTKAEGVFVGLHETGLNDLLSVLMFPRFRNFGPAAWPVPPVPSQWTTIQPLVIGAFTMRYALQFLKTPSADVDPLLPSCPWPTAGPANVVLQMTCSFIVETPPNSNVFSVSQFDIFAQIAV